MKREPNPWRSVSRAALGVYTALLLTATHWPGLVVQGPVDWTDKIIHCGVFCIWTCLFYLAQLIGGCTCGKRRLIWAIVSGFCFAVFDETTQPIFNRVFDLLDLAADCLGVLLAAGLITGARRVWPRFRGDLGE